MSRFWFPTLCTVLLLTGAASAGSIEQDKSNRNWTLESGGAVYRLAERDGQLVLDYFGPASQAHSRSHQQEFGADISGQAEGESLNPDSLQLVSGRTEAVAKGVAAVVFTMRHRRLPFKLEVRYTAWGDTGVFTGQITMRNDGTSSIGISSSPSLTWTLPYGNYTLRCLHGGWGEEHQLGTESLNPGIRHIGSATGRSTNGFAPWISLRDEDRNIEYLAEMAWSGNWDAEIRRQPGKWPSRMSQQQVEVKMGLHFDFGGPLNLPARAAFALPTVAFTASQGDLDDVTNQMHRYQRNYVFPRSSADRPPLVQFNSWYPFPGKMNIADMLRLADVAASLGAEVFVLDAGWYNHIDWSKELGDYEPDPQAFPHGLQELSSYVHQKGMKFGLWLEIENIGLSSHIYQEHRDWCLAYNGAPIHDADRCQLDFAKPEVRQWATATVERLIKRYDLSWIKIDYNIDIGDRFDPHGKDRPGDVLYRHISNYYAWLDRLRASHPQLIIENCSSGGLRFDTGILAHTDTNWLSDNVDPIASLELGFGCTVQFAAEVCNHWMVGDTDRGEVDLSKPPGWWDFMFRVPMNGQFGLSSRVFDWNQALRDRASQNIALYKSMRETIATADTYHLTAEPALHDPAGWMVIQYVSPSNGKSVVMAYRLRDSEPQAIFKLRSLNPSTTYRVLEDQKQISKATGRDLMDHGLPVDLKDQWRATAFEIEPVQ